MVFVKQLVTLLAGQMAGSNSKANFVVKSLRVGYTLSATGIIILWYSGYRNERVEVGKAEFPFPGLSRKKRKFKPDREEKELFTETAEAGSAEQFGTSVGRLPKSKATRSALEKGVQGNLTGLPQTPKEAGELHGTAQFDGHPVDRWIIPYLIYARSHGWAGHVESGFRTLAEGKAIWTNPSITVKARPGTSNHEKANFPGGAVDVTNAAQLSRILEEIPGGSLLKWAGNADPVHFSYPHNGGF